MIQIEKMTCRNNNDNKHYRMDIKIFISENKYFCVEFFEGYHMRKDDMIMNIENNRIMNILYNNNDIDKILFVGVFWEKFLNDKEYFKNFINQIHKKYENYLLCDNKDEFCINALDKIIKNKFLSKSLYLSHENKNNPIINIEELNKIIKFKDNLSTKKHIIEFIKDTDELKKNTNNDFDDDDTFLIDDDYNNDNNHDNNSKEIYCQNGKLTFGGLITYLQVDKKYLINIDEHQRLINFPIKITDALIYAHEERFYNLNNLGSNRIIGLDNF